MQNIIDNKYRLLKKISRGGQGEVYLAEHFNDEVSFKKLVAIKFVSKNETTKEKFFKEVNTHSKLHHPNICSVLDVGTTDDHFFLVLEYVEGLNLKDFQKKLIEKNLFLNDSAIASISLEILNALIYIHSNNFFHGDVTPHNILISSDLIVKLIDFGVAKSFESGNSKVEGKPAYLPMSYLNDNEYYSSKIELYSLAVLLFEFIQRVRINGEIEFDISIVPNSKFREVLNSLKNFDGDYTFVSEKLEQIKISSSSNLEEITKKVFNDKIIIENTMVSSDSNIFPVKKKNPLKKIAAIAVAVLFLGALSFLFHSIFSQYKIEKRYQSFFKLIIKEKSSTKMITPPTYPFSTAKIKLNWFIYKPACELACRDAAFTLVGGRKSNSDAFLKFLPPGSTIKEFYNYNFNIFIFTSTWFDQIYGKCDFVNVCNKAKEFKQALSKKIDLNQDLNRAYIDYENYMNEEHFTKDDILLLKEPFYYPLENESKQYSQPATYLSSPPMIQIQKNKIYSFKRKFSEEDCRIVGDYYFLLNLMEIPEDFKPINIKTPFNITLVDFDPLLISFDKNLKSFTVSKDIRSATICNYRREDAKLVYFNYWKY